MSELKPCPFCGGNGEVEKRDTPDSRGDFWATVACRDCCIGLNEGVYSDDLNMAVYLAKAAWNTRPIEDRLRAVNAELVELLAGVRALVTDIAADETLTDAAFEAVTSELAQIDAALKRASGEA